MSAGVTPELLALVDKMRYQLTALQGQLTEVKRQLADLPQADEEDSRFPCPHCGPLQNVRSQQRLEEHLANVHAEGLEEAVRAPETRPEPEGVLAQLFDTDTAA